VRLVTRDAVSQRAEIGGGSNEIPMPPIIHTRHAAASRNVKLPPAPNMPLSHYPPFLSLFLFLRLRLQVVSPNVIAIATFICLPDLFFGQEFTLPARERISEEQAIKNSSFLC